MSAPWTLVLLLALLIQNAGAFYSINYAADLNIYPKIVNAGASFTSAPSAEHVADVYARLSGHAPLYKTDSDHLPTIDTLTEMREPVMLLEINGGSKTSYSELAWRDHPTFPHNTLNTRDSSRTSLSPHPTQDYPLM